MSTQASEMSDGQARCQGCEEVIGVYEPLIAIVDGEPVETSRANIEGPAYSHVDFYHRSCFLRWNEKAT